MVNEYWVIRTEENGLDHYYTVKDEYPKGYVTVCGLVISDDFLWYQFHTTDMHTQPQILLFPRAGYLQGNGIGTVPLNYCPICKDNLLRIKLLEELGE